MKFHHDLKIYDFYYFTHRIIIIFGQTNKTQDIIIIE